MTSPATEDIRRPPILGRTFFLGAAVPFALLGLLALRASRARDDMRVLALWNAAGKVNAYARRFGAPPAGPAELGRVDREPGDLTPGEPRLPFRPAPNLFGVLAYRPLDGGRYVLEAFFEGASAAEGFPGLGHPWDHPAGRVRMYFHLLPRDVTIPSSELAPDSTVPPPHQR